MSMLGISLLNEHFRTFGIQQPDVVLGYLRDRVKETLAQKGSDSDQKEGMDMALVHIDPEKRELRFAGANRPLFLFRKKGPAADESMAPYLSAENEEYALYVIKGDQQPIGMHWEENPFSTHRLPLRENDTLYMFTDGFVDQYGGAQRKKFKIPNFQKLLFSIQGESMERQKELIQAAFSKWRGKHEQIDDVTVFGLKVAFL
jgi:serine phosphatase RsbU (regulator of sigma subunit)